MKEICVEDKVTILILVETLLQLMQTLMTTKFVKSHNPYFSGNSFATPKPKKPKPKPKPSQSLF